MHKLITLLLFFALFGCTNAPMTSSPDAGSSDACPAPQTEPDYTPDATPYGTPPATACSACAAPWHLRQQQGIAWCEFCPGDIGYHVGGEPGFEPAGGTWCAVQVSHYFCDPAR